MNWFASHKKPLLITLGILGVIVVAIATWALLKAREPKPSVTTQPTNSQTSSQAADSSGSVDNQTSSSVDSLQNSLKNTSTDDTALDDALNDTNQQVTVPTE